MKLSPSVSGTRAWPVASACAFSAGVVPLMSSLLVLVLGAGCWSYVGVLSRKS